MFVNIMAVRVGDVILESGGRTTVTKIDSQICKNKTHVNDKDCYENFADVRLAV